MDFLKNRVFSRKSGIRNLVSLLLAALGLIWLYVCVSLITGDDRWLAALLREAEYDDLVRVFIPVCVSAGIGCAVLSGWLVCRSAEKWGLRLLLKSGFSFLDAIPLVNLIAPLVYRHKWKKEGQPTNFGDGLRESLRATVHEVLVENNAIFHANGKLRYGLVRFVFVAVFRIIRGVFCLLGALIVPVLFPILPIAGCLIITVIADANMEVAQWIGRGIVALTVLCGVVQPVIALLLHPEKSRQTGHGPEKVSMPELLSDEISGPEMSPFVPVPLEEPMSAMDDPDDEEPDYGDDPDSEGPGYEDDPAPETDTGDTAPAEDDGDGMTQAADGKEIVEVTECNVERCEDREIENQKETIL